MRYLSYFASVVFHPLLMTTWFVLATVWWAPSAVGLDTLMINGKWVITGIYALLTFVLPMISTIILRVFSNISSFQLEDRRERLLPMSLISLYYVLAAYFLVYQSRVATPLAAVTLAVTITLVVLTLITFFWKISAHSGAAWGCAGLALGLHEYSPEPTLKFILIAFILVAGIVASARLYLGAHSLKQVVWGGFTGFTICLLTLYLIL